MRLLVLRLLGVGLVFVARALKRLLRLILGILRRRLILVRVFLGLLGDLQSLLGLVPRLLVLSKRRICV